MVSKLFKKYRYASFGNTTFGSAYEYRFDEMFYLNSVSRVELIQVHRKLLPEYSFYAINYGIKKL